MAAAVCLPAVLIVRGAEGLLLAETGRGHAIRRDSQSSQVLFYGIGAAVAEHKVVFRRAALVTVALDGDLNLRMTFQEIGGLGERLARIRPDVCLIEIEVGVAYLFQEKLIISGPHRGR